MAKKSRVKTITDEQYLAYVAGLKQEDAALFDLNGELVVPDVFKKEKRD